MPRGHSLGYRKLQRQVLMDLVHAHASSNTLDGIAQSLCDHLFHKHPAHPTGMGGMLHEPWAKRLVRRQVVAIWGANCRATRLEGRSFDHGFDHGSYNREEAVHSPLGFFWAHYIVEPVCFLTFLFGVGEVRGECRLFGA